MRHLFKLLCLAGLLTTRTVAADTSASSRQGPSLDDLSGTRPTWTTPKTIPMALIKKDFLSGEQPKLPDVVLRVFAGKIVTGSYKVCIATTGKIGSVVTIDGIPGADDSIIETVLDWRYKPQMIPICFIQYFQFHPRQISDEAAARYEREQLYRETFQRFFQECESLFRTGRYQQALPSCQKAEELAAASFGATEQIAARAKHLLAMTYHRLGKYELAEPRYQQALALHTKFLGSRSIQVQYVLSDLAVLFLAQGRADRAESIFKQILSVHESLAGWKHPLIATSLNQLARLEFARNQGGMALTYVRRAIEVVEELLKETVSEPRATLLLEEQRQSEEMLYGLLLEQANLPGLLPLALNLSFLRKGRTAQIGAAVNRSVLSNLTDPGVRRRFVEWQRLRTERETLLFAGPAGPSLSEHQAQLLKLEEVINEKEHQLALAVPSARRAMQVLPWNRVLGQVVSRLRPNSALLEVVQSKSYRFDASPTEQRWGKSHYIAMLLFANLRIEIADLGPAEEVDQRIAELQQHLQDPSRDPLPSAQKVYRQIMQPLEAPLRNIAEVYLSLDGSLQLIPFGALHEGSRYLIDRYDFKYLTSGRDLLNDPHPESVQPPLVIADPDYGVTLPAAGAASVRVLDEGLRSLYGTLTDLRRLPATHKEAEHLALLLPDAEIRLGQAATEEVLRRAAGPRILHIATHGVLLSDSLQDAQLGDDSTLRAFRPLSPAITDAMVERVLGQRLDNPLSRSALILAGAGSGQKLDAEHDGLLTAEEVRSLNLWGTELVVLSACDSGRGAVRVGQGVFGLRRAFFIAGAETLVTSLWRVSDVETGELMRLYYEGLIKHGQPRVGAMKGAMQALRKRKPHPYYWAPFIVLGLDGPLHALSR